jgi:hypothetical protein
MFEYMRDVLAIKQVHEIHRILVNKMLSFFNVTFGTS